MRGFTAGLAALVSVLALTGCDPQSKAGAAAGAREDALASLATPVPERFQSARSPGGGLDLAALPAASPPGRAATAQLKRASSLNGDSASLASEEDQAQRAAAAFDNTRASSPLIPDSRRAGAGTVRLEDRQFHVDTDGRISDPAERRRVVSHDRWHWDGTALTIGGRALDSTRVPYISIPGDFSGARLGDLAQVCYGGRCAYAVVGDVGPKGRFGEGSVALARELGINDDGNTGGVERGVSYTLFPGSSGPRPSQARLVEDIRSRGPRLALAAGLPSAIRLASL